VGLAIVHIAHNVFLDMAFWKILEDFVLLVVLVVLNVIALVVYSALHLLHTILLGLPVLFVRSIRERIVIYVTVPVVLYVSGAMD